MLIGSPTAVEVSYWQTRTEMVEVSRYPGPPVVSDPSSAAEWGDFLRQTASELASTPSHARANEVFRRGTDVPPTVEGFRNVSVGILRNATVEPWLPELYVALLNEGIKADFSLGDYAVYERYAASPLELREPAPDIFLLYMEPAALVGDARHDPPRDTAESILVRVEAVVGGLLARTGAMIVIGNLAPEPIRFHRLHGDQDPGSWPQLRRRMNTSLLATFHAEPRVAILDLDRVVAEYGASRAFDPRMYLMARNPFAVDFLPHLGRAFADIVVTATVPLKKCVVVDCDNTLWGGVLGEEGPELVAIGTDYPGEAYREFQQFLRGLGRRGFLLAINSKNNEEEVLSFLADSPDMVLRPGDFTAHRINWNDKGSNLAEIAEEMNIGLDSMIFVDDSPVECARIRSAFPEVLVEQFPANPAEIPRFIANLRGTQRLRVEAEDLKRARSLSANARRQRLKRQAPDLETFVRSLEIRLVIERQNRTAIPRVSQLTQRTNQFNLTTKRYSPGDIERLMNGGIVYTMGMEDRFSDYGIVGVAIVTDTGTDSWEIDSFMLSCRAFGRGIESELLATVLADAGAVGIKVVRARYVATAKNGMSRDFFPGHGFSLTERSDGELRFKATPGGPPTGAGQELYQVLQQGALS